MSDRRIQAKDLPDEMVWEELLRDEPGIGRRLEARGFPTGVVHAKLTRFLNRDHVDYGVSLFQCFLTEKGRAEAELAMRGGPGA
jgi:hypothetical protein